MISAGDFRNGVTIELEGNIYQIIEFQHVKPGKGFLCLLVCFVLVHFLSILLSMLIFPCRVICYMNIKDE